MFYSKNELKFLSDENFPKEVDRLLRKQGHNIKKVPLGSTDKQISKIAKSESRIILTFDKHFLNKKLFPPKEHSGIVVFKLSPPLIDSIVFLLSRLFKEVKSTKFKGKLFVISPFAFRTYPSIKQNR